MATNKRSVKDISIRDEVANRIERGHGVLSIPHDVLLGLYGGLKKRFGFHHVADTTLNNKTAQTRVIQAKQDVNYKSDKVTQILSKNAANQTQYLVSIDQRLKDIEVRLNQSNQLAKEQEQESKVARMKAEQAATKALNKQPTPIRRGGVGQSVKNFASDNLTIGNLFKYGASVALTGVDFYKGMQSSDEWGRGKLMSGLIGMFGGNKQGGAFNAVSKGFSLATVGAMLKGPIGAMIGMVIGTVTGFLGSDKLNGFIKDFTENQLKKVPAAISKVMDEKKNADKKLEADTKELQLLYANDIHDTMMDFFKDTQIRINAGTGVIIAGAEKSIAKALKSVGLTSLASYFDKKADDKLEEVASEAKKQVSETTASRQKRDEKRAADKASAIKRVAEDKENTGYVAATTRVIHDALNSSADHPEVAKTDITKPVTKSEPATAATAITPPTQQEIQKPGDIKEAPEITDYDTSPKLMPASYTTNDGSVGPDLTVGQVQGDDIKKVADAASAIKGVKGDLVERVPPEALAAIVAKESKGNLSVPDGDHGTAKGITQVRPMALKEINKAFGLSLAHNDLKDFPQAALLAGALYLKLMLHKHKGNLSAALAAYNGAGPRALDYAKDTMGMVNKFRSDHSPQAKPKPMVPRLKMTGQNINVASRESNDLRDYNDRNGGKKAPIAPVITSVNTVNNSQTVNMPMPNTRNDEPSFMRTLMG